MAIIVPAVLEKSLDAIKVRLTSVLGEATLIQIDVVDGTFAPNRTWPFAAPEQAGEFAEILSGEENFPLWDSFNFQFDLMVEDIAREEGRWEELPASALIVHASSRGARGALEALQAKRGGEYPTELGVALSTSVSADALEEFSGLFDFVQVMGIAKPGFQGEPFDPRALELIAALRADNRNLTIQVDGGVGREHLSEVLRAGADRVAEGSLIFSAEDPKQALRELFSTPF